MSQHQNPGWRYTSWKAVWPVRVLQSIKTLAVVNLVQVRGNVSKDRMSLGVYILEDQHVLVCVLLCVNIHRQKRARALLEWENLLHHLFTWSNTCIFMRLSYFMYLPEQTQHRTLVSCWWNHWGAPFLLVIFHFFEFTLRCEQKIWHSQAPCGFVMVLGALLLHKTMSWSHPSTDVVCLSVTGVASMIFACWAIQVML